jgi:hypothetical protein
MVQPPADARRGADATPWQNDTMPTIFLDCAAVQPRTAVAIGLFTQGAVVVRTHPLVFKLLTQLAPAALVTGLGIAMLSNLSKPADPVLPAATEPAIIADAVFTPLPPAAAKGHTDSADAAQQSGTAAAPRTAAKPKPAATAPATPPKVAAYESAPAREPIAPPLQIVPPEAERTDNTMMGRLRGMGTAVRQMPQRAYATVTDWFSEHPPPRPPEPVPARNFL